MSYNSDLEKVRRKAEEQGWRYRRTEGGHHQFYSPDKETIVTAAGTPSDQRGWLNFLADMKRGGFRSAEDYGTVAQALVEAQNKATKPEPSSQQAEQSVEPSSTTTQPTITERSEVTKPKVSAVDHVRSLLRNSPGKAFQVQEVVSKVQAAEKGHKMAAIAMALKSLTDRGELVRVSQGFYQWKGDKKAAPAKEKPKPETNGIDSDLVALDAALAALDKVGEIVLRNREMLLKLIEFKKLLPGG